MGKYMRLLERLVDHVVIRCWRHCLVIVSYGGGREAATMR